MTNAVELTRYAKTMEAFIARCRTALNKTGNESLISAWADLLNDMPNTLEQGKKSPYYHRHYDETGTLKEICSADAEGHQVFLRNAYNFIFEYSDGRGYFYLSETPQK